MADEALRDALRAFESGDRSTASADRVLELCSRSNQPPPWEAIARSSAWSPLCTWVRDWYGRSLAESDGVSPAALDQTEKRLGVQLPREVREWFRLAGACEDFPGLCPGRSDGCDLTPLAGLFLEDETWLTLARGHQQSEWAVRIQEGLTAFLRRCGTQEGEEAYEQGDVAGGVPEVIWGFLIDEFLHWPRVGADGVEKEVDGPFSGAIRERVQRAYQKLPLTLFGEPDWGVAWEAFESDDTLVLLYAEVSSLYAAKTPEAWAKISAVIAGG